VFLEEADVEDDLEDPELEECVEAEEAVLDRDDRSPCKDV
jgi:hypothetical protein